MSMSVEVSEPRQRTAVGDNDRYQAAKAQQNNKVGALPLEKALVVFVDDQESQSYRLLQYDGLGENGRPILEEPTVAMGEGNRALNVLREFGALMIIMGAKQREASRNSRHAERDLVVETIHLQADKIRDIAWKNFIGNIVSNSFQMAGGVFQAAMSSGRIQLGGLPITNLTDIGRGGSQVLQAVGDIGRAGYSLSAGLDEEAKKRLEADERVYTYAQSNESELMDTMRGLTVDTYRIVDAAQGSVYQVQRGLIQAMV